MAAEVLTASLPSDPTQWHAGNLRMQSLMSAPAVANPVTPFLTPPRAMTLASSPLIAVGTLDPKGRPWTTLWGGEKGCISILNEHMIGVNSVIDRQHDPVIEACSGIKADGEIFGGGQSMSALGIDLETRRRVKLSAGIALNGQAGEASAHSQAVLEVETSLGNCPKYLNAKYIVPAIPAPVVEKPTLPLGPAALSLVSKADCFFLTATAGGLHMSTNYRGGPRGFIRVPSNASSVTLAYPEYSGNRLYQTLGNLQVTPLSGVVIPDFETGDALYATCETSILVGDQAASLVPRSNLVVLLTIKEALFVRESLGFRATDGEPSPYNPRVRQLVSERSSDGLVNESIATATLVERTMLSENVARLKFATDKPIFYERGQHAILGFEDELGTGYAHMNDADPTSLNDDLVRSFTVTSDAPVTGEHTQSFELVVRNVGRVTGHLFKSNLRAGLNASSVGFGGRFAFDASAGVIGFVAGGVGITPLLNQMIATPASRLKVWWTVGAKDLSIAQSLVRSWKEIPDLRLFVTGVVLPSHEESLNKIKEAGIQIVQRRLKRGDLTPNPYKISKWYICAVPQLKLTLEEWLRGEETVSEDFNF